MLDCGSARAARSFAFEVEVVPDPFFVEFVKSGFIAGLGIPGL
jgi:hypothetical protein